MCIHLLGNGYCKLRIVDSEGRQNFEISIKIREAFLEVSQKSPHYKDSKLGVACGARLCCFAGGKYAVFSDCPYYQQN